MKRIITFCVTIILFLGVFAQAPNEMSYQAVIRNSSNELVINTTVGMKISILQASPSGVAVYAETQTPTSNSNGLVSVEIGGGTVVAGNFSSIDWADGPYFIKTETDPNGGSNYSISGTSQLLSVPYALYAKLGGLNVIKLHTEDELNLIVTNTVGPNIPGSSWNIGDISKFSGLLLEWRMNDRSEVFHQTIYLSEYDKDVILGNITEPTDYPRKYTAILSNDFGTMLWIGVSLEGTQIYISTNSSASSYPKLQRIFGIL